jgi:hypothetical protein
LEAVRQVHFGSYIHIEIVLQRWKEKFFVNVGAECGLTIAGFYYVCFSRSDGSVHGFYYDPNSRYGSSKKKPINLFLDNWCLLQEGLMTLMNILALQSFPKA